MELSIDQALQQAVSAHNSGNIKEAESIYHWILHSQPRHPDASHNLGLIAINTNQIGLALRLFKIAVDVNPSVEQFWISYTDALVKDDQLESAKQAIKKAKKNGFDDKKMEILLLPANLTADTKVPSQEQVSVLAGHYQNGRYDDAEKVAVSLSIEFPCHNLSWKVLGAIFKHTGRIPESLVAKEKAVELSPYDAEAHYNLGNALQDSGRLEDAETSLRQAIALKPYYAESHNNLGSTLKELGRLEEAKVSYTQAIALKPDFAEAHSNCGITLKALGRLEEAEARYREAIALKPDYAEAYSNLGSTLQDLGRLDEAEVSHRQAITLKPHFAEAHNNLGNTLQHLDRMDETVASYIQALKLKPDFTDAKANLSQVIKSIRFNSSVPQLYPVLIDILTTGNTVRPIDVASSILSLLKNDPLIKDLLSEDKFLFNRKAAISAIENLDKVRLLHHLMRVCPLPDLNFEELFVALRSSLLNNLDAIQVSPELIYFLSTLSLHCFTNNYVYVETIEETRLVAELEAKITQILGQSEQPKVIQILCLASYRPLYQYDWCEKLEAFDHLKEVKKRLIEEPRDEKVISAETQVLGEISDDLSRKVRAQYEEHPYPRWVKTGIPTKAKSISEVCDDINLYLHSESIKNITNPAILIAGCGTGQHSIDTACRFSSCHVIAVDLSLTSLAYAQRKSNEFCLSNLEYLQADILDLHQLGRKFDIIESAGVLHHMDEPIAGWRVLTELLKSGGLMKIGLYSELARGHIIKTREKIASLGLKASETEIRNFRQSVISSGGNNHERLIASPDFFSMSEIRDLLFHVQEHCFTIPMIQECLDQLGLMFCGFESNNIVPQFKGFHGEDSDIYDLTLWHEFEKNSPETFGGMYQFWCQKL